MRIKIYLLTGFRIRIRCFCLDPDPDLDQDPDPVLKFSESWSGIGFHISLDPFPVFNFLWIRIRFQPPDTGAKKSAGSALRKLRLNKIDERCLDPDPVLKKSWIRIQFVPRGWIQIRFVLRGWIRIRQYQTGFETLLEGQTNFRGCDWVGEMVASTTAPPHFLQFLQSRKSQRF